VKENPGRPCGSAKVVDFQGNMSKFTGQPRRAPGRYWSLVNRWRLRVVTRKHCVLCGSDLEHWDIAGDVID